MAGFRRGLYLTPFLSRTATFRRLTRTTKHASENTAGLQDGSQGVKSSKAGSETIDRRANRGDNRIGLWSLNYPSKWGFGGRSSLPPSKLIMGILRYLIKTQKKDQNVESSIVLNMLETKVGVTTAAGGGAQPVSIITFILVMVFLLAKPSVFQMRYVRDAAGIKLHVTDIAPILL